MFRAKRKKKSLTPRLSAATCWILQSPHVRVLRMLSDFAQRRQEKQ
jgi:hypothetical protein